MSNEIAACTYPAWLQQLTGEEQAQERLRFLIRKAALHATRNGSVDSLCAAVGMRPSAFLKFMRTKSPERMSGEIAVTLERVVGRECVTRQELAPHIFL